MWLHLKHKIQLEVNNKIIEQVISFNVLGNLTSCEKEMEIDKKLKNVWKQQVPVTACWDDKNP